MKAPAARGGCAPRVSKAAVAVGAVVDLAAFGDILIVAKRGAPGQDMIILGAFGVILICGWLVVSARALKADLHRAALLLALGAAVWSWFFVLCRTAPRDAPPQRPPRGPGREA